MLRAALWIFAGVALFGAVLSVGLGEFVSGLGLGIAAIGLIFLAHHERY